MADSGDVLSEFLAGKEGDVNIIVAGSGSSGSYSSNNKADFDAITNMIVDEYGLSKTSANAVVETWTKDFFTFNHHWPRSVNDVWADPSFHSAASRQAAPGLNTLPELFQTEGGIYNNTSDLGMPQQVRGRAGAVLAREGDLPFVPTQAVIDALVPASMRSGGGGRGGPAPFTLDRAAVRERIREDWRPMMLEEPANLESLTDSYISEAKSFRRQGGSLDLSVWTRGKMRGTSRYRALYGKKPESLSEDQWMGQYTAATRQFGFNESATVREIEAGATSGAGVAGFQERVGRTREASLQSPWSVRMAQTVGKLGALTQS